MNAATEHLTGLDRALAAAVENSAVSGHRHLHAVAAGLRRAELPAHWASAAGLDAWLDQLADGRLAHDDEGRAPSPDTVAAYCVAMNKLLRAAGKPGRLPIARTHRREPIAARDRDRLLVELDAAVDVHRPGSRRYLTAVRNAAVACCIADTGVHVAALNAATVEDVDLAAGTLTLTDRRPGQRTAGEPRPYPLTGRTQRALYRWLSVRAALVADHTGVHALWVTLGGSYTADSPGHRRPPGLPIVDPRSLSVRHREAAGRLDEVAGRGLLRELHPGPERDGGGRDGQG